MWPVASVPDNIHLAHFRDCRKFSCAALVAMPQAFRSSSQAGRLDAFSTHRIGTCQLSLKAIGIMSVWKALL